MTGEHAGVPVGRVVSFHNDDQQAVVAVVLDDQQAAGGVGVHYEVAGGIGHSAGGEGGPLDGHRLASRWLRRGAGIAGSAPLGGGQDRARFLGADEVDDLDVGAEVGDLAGS